MSTLAERMTPSITTMIRMDHTYVLAVFHRYKPDAPAARKRTLVLNACLALELHAQVEEEIFYSELRTLMPGDPVLDKSQPEHDAMRQLMAELREQAAGSDPMLDRQFDDKFMELMRTVIHHVADEETRLIPAAERLLGDRVNQLGARMNKRRMELMKPRMGELAASTIRSFPGFTAAGVVLTAGAAVAGAMLLSRRANGRAHRL